MFSGLLLHRDKAAGWRGVQPCPPLKEHEQPSIIQSHFLAVMSNNTALHTQAILFCAKELFKSHGMPIDSSFNALRCLSVTFSPLLPAHPLPSATAKMHQFKNPPEVWDHIAPLVALNVFVNPPLNAFVILLPLSNMRTLQRSTMPIQRCVSCLT